MRLKPFLLDAWLDSYEHGIEFNLAASTGPAWTAAQVGTWVRYVRVNGRLATFTFTVTT